MRLATFGMKVPEDERQAWGRWLRRHGINPNDVPTHGAIIEADDERRRVVYTSIVKDRLGRVKLDHAHCRHLRGLPARFLPGAGCPLLPQIEFRSVQLWTDLEPFPTDPARR